MWDLKGMGNELKGQASLNSCNLEGFGALEGNETRSLNGIDNQCSRSRKRGLRTFLLNFADTVNSSKLAVG